MNRVVVAKEHFDKMMDMASACLDRKSNRGEYRGLICVLKDGKFTVGASNGKILQRIMVESDDYTLDEDEWVFEFSVDGINKVKGFKPVEIRQNRDGEIEVCARDEHLCSTIWIRKNICDDVEKVKKLLGLYEEYANAEEDKSVVMLDVALLEKAIKAYKGSKGCKTEKVIIGVGRENEPLLMTNMMTSDRIDTVVLPLVYYEKNAITIRHNETKESTGE